MKRVKEKRRNPIEKICIILLLASVATGCLQKDTDLPTGDKQNKGPESTVHVKDKVEGGAEKTVPVEYYVEEKISDIDNHYAGFLSNKFWLSTFNIADEEGNEMVAQCREAFEQNAGRLARDVPTKIPENWAASEVQLKKEKFLMENETPILGRFDDIMIARFHGIGFDANTSAFDDLVLHIVIANDCVYNLKEKKVEKIRISFLPVLWSD